MRVLVTRPEGQASGLLASLRERGFATLHLPMLAIEALEPLPAAQRQRLRELDRYRHLIFISANAVRFGLALIDAYWPQYPERQRYWAVGESTAAALEAAGLTVQRPGRDMRSEALLAMPALRSPGGERVLLVKGEGGRDLLQRTLAQRGALVQALECYRRVAPSLDAAACRERLAAAPVDLILISSGEGLQHLSRLLTPKEHTNLADTALIVPSPRVAQQAVDLGWRRVRCAENASDAAMVRAACSPAVSQGGEVEH